MDINKSGAYLVDEHGRQININLKDIFTEDAQELLLEKCANEILFSLQQGYYKQKSPTGETWPENPEWWQILKKHTMANIGLSIGSGFVGPYTAHTKHMKDSMVKTIDMSQKQATITFLDEAKMRAFITNYGSDNVQKREHFGFATWNRHPQGTDVEVCEKIIQEIIEEGMNRTTFGQ